MQGGHMLRFTLTQNYRQAAADLARDMAAFASAPERWVVIPVLNENLWDEGDNNNCYNFAMDRCTRDFMQPGELSGAWQYASSDLSVDVHNAALADGAVYLGSSILNCPADRWPVALFLAHHRAGDFDWMTVRKTPNPNVPQRLVWCGKNGDAGPSVVVGGETIFQIAEDHDLPYFAGYYGFSPDMTARPRHQPPECRFR